MMTSFIGRWARVTTRYRDDASGNIAIVFALMGVVLMLAIGAAVDVSRWLNARDQTVAAIDAAVLAGGRALQTNSHGHGCCRCGGAEVLRRERHLAASRRR